jgi:hypothetical protein
MLWTAPPPARVTLDVGAGLTCIWAGRSHGDWSTYRADVRATYHEIISLAPNLAERLSAARQASALRGTSKLPNFYRTTKIAQSRDETTRFMWMSSGEKSIQRIRHPVEYLTTARVTSQPVPILIRPYAIGAIACRCSCLRLRDERT